MAQAVVVRGASAPTDPADAPAASEAAGTDRRVVATRVVDLTKVYGTGKTMVRGLDGISVAFGRGSLR